MTWVIAVSLCFKYYLWKSRNNTGVGAVVCHPRIKTRKTGRPAEDQCALHRAGVKFGLVLGEIQHIRGKLEVNEGTGDRGSLSHWFGYVIIA